MVENSLYLLSEYSVSKEVTILVNLTVVLKYMSGLNKKWFIFPGIVVGP